VFLLFQIFANLLWADGNESIVKGAKRTQLLKERVLQYLSNHENLNSKIFSPGIYDSEAYVFSTSKCTFSFSKKGSYFRAKSWSYLKAVTQLPLHFVNPFLEQTDIPKNMYPISRDLLRASNGFQFTLNDTHIVIVKQWEDNMNWICTVAIQKELLNKARIKLPQRFDKVDLLKAIERAKNAVVPNDQKILYEVDLTSNIFQEYDIYEKISQYFSRKGLKPLGEVFRGSEVSNENILDAIGVEKVGNIAPDSHVEDIIKVFLSEPYSPAVNIAIGNHFAHQGFLTVANAFYYHSMISSVNTDNAFEKIMTNLNTLGRVLAYALCKEINENLAKDALHPTLENYEKRGWNVGRKILWTHGALPLVPTEDTSEFLFPENSFFQRGFKQLRKKNYQEALSYFMESLEKEPFHQDTVLCIATTFYSLKEYWKALIFFKQALQIIPASIYATKQYGLCLEKLSLVEQANGFYEDCLEYFPPGSEIYKNSATRIVGVSR
jgi:tetratricopeptide (TPR) repeat protein